MNRNAALILLAIGLLLLVNRGQVLGSGLIDGETERPPGDPDPHVPVRGFIPGGPDVPLPLPAPTPERPNPIPVPTPVFVGFGPLDDFAPPAPLPAEVDFLLDLPVIGGVSPSTIFDIVTFDIPGIPFF